MQYPLLSEYVSAITHASENLDQLKHLEVVQDEHGEPYRSSGAFAVVFKMRDPRTGQLYALKCFTEEQEEHTEAYRKIEEELEVAGTTYLTSMRYYERELFVDSSVSSASEFPVLLMDWVEGSTMELYIREHYRDSYAMEMLCYRFCRLAAYLRSQPFAHGDVKPDNIMVSDTGTLTLIDYDGMFVPSMQGESSPTLGTEEFRHPLRTPELFDATIDDFALASIALSLRAIALDSQLLDQYGAPDRLLFSASDYRDLAQSKVMQAIWRLVGDKDLCKLVGLFVLAHAEQSLASTSFQLLSTTRPEKPVVVPLSTKVTDEDLAEAYTDEYGVKFSPDRKRLLKAPRELVSYTIPDTVTTICYRAFYLCYSLTSLTIPNSVTAIGDGAFSSCCLTSLTIPNAVTSIGDSAFRSCYRITSLTIPDSVISIGDSTFRGCYSLTSLTIPNSVTSIGDSAFSGCRSLTSLTIPNSVTSIGQCAFCECSRLTSLTIPDSVTTIGANPFSKQFLLLENRSLHLENRSPHFYVDNNVLFTADKSQLIAYCSIQTSYSIPSSVTSIGNRAFWGCSSLTSLTIPSSVTSIGDSAFWCCSSLTSLTIPSSVISIGDSAFSDCSSLTSLTIPKSVNTIGDSVFKHCSSLISLTIPNSVTSIGNRAFLGCSRLTSLTIPKSVTTIGVNPFQGVRLHLENQSPYLYVEDNVLFTANKSQLISYCSTQTSYTIPNSVISIGDEAFSDCENLTSLTIPNSVISIGDSAFENCTRLTSLTIPNSVTTIGKGAFATCEYLTSLTIPSSVTTIGRMAFWECFNLSSITIPNSVTSIGDWAFYNCASLTSITIPNSITTIENNLFDECYNLTSLMIPDSVTSIGDYAFSGCSRLTSLTIPYSVTSIGKRALYGCNNLNQSTREELEYRFGDQIF